MTVSVPAQLVYDFNADGVTTTFSYPVRFLGNDELTVILIDGDGVETTQGLTVDYTVSAGPWPNGGDVVFNSAPDSGLTVRIYRDTTWEQIVDLEDKTRNPAQAVEEQLDRLAMAGQDVRRVAQDFTLSLTDLNNAVGRAETAEDGAEAAQAAAEAAAAQAEATLDFLNLVAVGVGNETDLISALDAGKAVATVSSVSSFTLTTEAQVQSVLAGLDRILVLGDSLTIYLPVGHHAIPAAAVVRSAKIKLVGAAPVETTISSIASVTGSAGAWSVTANVADATGMAVGDVVCVRGVTPGVQMPGTYTSRPPIGAIQMQFFQNGELSLNGTTGTVGGPDLTTYVSSGDFLIADGKVKRMLSITGTGFSVDAGNAPPKAYSGKQYWYTMRPSAAGTVTVSGTTVTGSSTGFTSRVNAGDLIAFHNNGIRKVVSVDSDTQLTLDHSHPTIGTGVTWGVITPGELHEGAWVITGIAGNQVTWTNTQRTTYGPPKNLINGGSVYCLKTNLVFSGTSGFVADSGVLEADKIGMRGSGGSATVAIDLRGEGGTRAGQATLGTRFGVAGFHYGAWLSTGAMLQATATHWGGQLTRGINVAGGEARIGSASITGTAGVGVFVGEGAYARMADTRIGGCTLQGFRAEVGASFWADFAIIGHCVTTNVLIVGGVDVHLVGARCFGSGSSGVAGQNGGYGRATGITLLGNFYRGLDFYNGSLEANQLIAMGCSNDGAVLARGNYAVEEAAFGYNNRAVYVPSLSRVSASGNMQIVGHSAGLVSSGEGLIYAPNSGFAGNTTDAQAATGGKIIVRGQAGGSTWSPALNTQAADGSLVSDA